MNSSFIKKLLVFVAAVLVLFGIVAVLKVHYENTVADVFFVRTVSTTKNEIAPVFRNISPEDHFKLDDALNELMKGPNPIEKEMGYFSDIPAKTRLLNIRQEKDAVIVDLSSDFTSGGGSESMTNRVTQVKKTVSANTNKKQVYLFVNGQKVDYIGGEGVEVSQPIAK